MLLTMSKHFAVVSAVLSALALTAAAAPATATAAPRPAAATVHVQQARFGLRSFGRRPVYRSPGYRTPSYRYYRRPGIFHGLGGGILKMLGIAYLFHMLFGIGAGGSPLGLLLL